MSFRIHKLPNHRDVLMLGLFAVIGFNMSLNPESSSIRQQRSIAAAAAESAKGKADLSSNLESLSFDLNDVLKEYDAKIYKVEVNAQPEVDKDNKVKTVHVLYRVVDQRATTEGQSIETCEICEKGKYNSLDIDGQYAGNNDYLKLLVQKALSDKNLALSAEEDRAKAAKKDREESEKDDSEASQFKKDAECKLSELTDKMSCQSDALQKIMDKCEDASGSKKRACSQLVVKYYDSKIAPTLKKGLNSEDSEERSKATELRDTLIENLSKNSSNSDASRIKRELVFNTRDGMMEVAKEAYNNSLENGSSQTLALQAARQALTDELNYSNGVGLCRALANDCNNLYVQNIKNPFANWMMLPDTSAASQAGLNFGNVASNNTTLNNTSSNSVNGSNNWQIRPGSPRLNVPGVQACTPGVNCPTSPNSIFGPLFRSGAAGTITPTTGLQNTTGFQTNTFGTPTTFAPATPYGVQNGFMQPTNSFMQPSSSIFNRVSSPYGVQQPFAASPYGYPYSSMPVNMMNPAQQALSQPHF